MKLDKFIVGILLIGLVSSMMLTMQRAKVENEYKKYEVTMDYAEAERFAENMDQDTKKVLLDFHEAGIHSVNISEVTIHSLKKNKDHRVITQNIGYDLMIQSNPMTLQWIEKGLKEVLAEPRKMSYPDDHHLLIEGKPEDYIFETGFLRDLSGNSLGGGPTAEFSKLEYVGLGYLDKEIQTVKDLGIKIALRPTYVESLQDPKKSVRRFEEVLDHYKINQDYVIFSGQEALAWDEEELMVDLLKDRSMTVAMIEASVQREHLEVKGMDSIARKTGYQAIRAFTTWQFIQKRYDYGIPRHHHGEEIVNSYYRAITERNIRLIYFKPFILPSGKVVTDMNIYKARLDDLQARLQKTHHILPGDPIPMKLLESNRLLQMIAAMGVIAAAFVILDNIVRMRRKIFYILYAVPAVGICGIYVAGLKVSLINKMMGLSATIIFPVLSITLALLLIKSVLTQKGKPEDLKVYFRGVSILLVCIVISLIGAIYEVAFFAESKYLLELDIFKGVKLSQMAPILIMGIVYLCIFGYKRENDSNYITIQEIVRFLGESIRVWQAIVVVGLLGVVVLLLLRSGHETNVQPSAVELFMRNTLEYLLPARPRTKAFMAAYPALILFVYLAFYKKYKILYPVLALMAVIGQSNILNTFSHIRTPLYISFLRVGYEFLCSLAVGAVFIVLAKGLINFFGKVRTNV